MKLLLDENLSRRIVPFLQEAFPGSSQVALLGLEQADDRAIWEFAKREGFVLVTKDADFYDLSVVLGAPPPVVWLKGLGRNKLSHLACLAARLRRCAKGYIAGLCAPLRALQANGNPAQSWDIYFCPRP